LKNPIYQYADKSVLAFLSLRVAKQKMKKYLQINVH